MTQSLTDLLGANAVDNGGTATINWADYVDENGQPLLADIPNSSPSQKMAALLHWLFQNSFPAKDANGNDIEDDTQTIVSQLGFTEKTFETRNDVNQVRHERTFAIYTSDNSIFDPDNAV